jgi:uncharacterized membrane-anchored protein
MSPLARALSLALVLGWSIYNRAAILRDGAEVVLKTEPVDPRDLLRGRYVRLGYEISSLRLNLLPEGQRADALAADTVHVHLVRQADGLWTADRADLVSGDGNGVWITGEITYRLSDDLISVEYGIERFYAPEYLAPEIERNMRDGEITQTVVAVAADGAAQIKALRQGDEALFVEPLY